MSLHWIATIVLGLVFFANTFSFQRQLDALNGRLDAQRKLIDLLSARLKGDSHAG